MTEIHEHATLPSTNDEARRLAEAGAPAGAAVRARTQTAGRGRAGRTWVSGEGGLYLSVILRPSLAPAQGGLLSLAAGLAMARLAEALGARPALRWPNDLCMGERKLGGVLCESRLRPDRAGFAWAVVGLGLNVAQPLAALAAVGGTTLSAELGGALDPGALARPLRDELTSAARLAERDPRRLLAEWAARAPMLGQPVTVTTEKGSWAGRAESVDATGALAVRTPAGLQRVSDPDLVRIRV